MAEQTVIDGMTSEDREAVRLILEQWKREGVAAPLLPMNVDVDGDGIVDAFGLGADGDVIFVSGAPLDSTVYLSEGDDAILHEAEES